MESRELHAPTARETTQLPPYMLGEPRYIWIEMTQLWIDLYYEWMDKEEWIQRIPSRRFSSLQRPVQPSVEPTRNMCPCTISLNDTIVFFIFWMVVCVSCLLVWFGLGLVIYVLVYRFCILVRLGVCV